MNANVGTIDRAVRIVIGVLLLAFCHPDRFLKHRMELDRLDRLGAVAHRHLRLLSGLPADRALDLFAGDTKDVRLRGDLNEELARCCD